MQLILAIDGDGRQADQLAALVRSRIGAELVQAVSAGEALQALGDRVPDLIMTSPLLSPFDDGVLAEYLRGLGPAAAHVQTLRIPVFAASPKKAGRGLFSLRRKRPVESAPNGCDPNVFADEIAVYLTRAAEERQSAVPAVGSRQMEPEPVQAYDAGSNDGEWTVAEPTVSESYFTEHEPVVYSSDAVDTAGLPPVDPEMYANVFVDDSPSPVPTFAIEPESINLDGPPLAWESADPIAAAVEEIAPIVESTASENVEPFREVIVTDEAPPLHAVVAEAEMRPPETIEPRAPQKASSFESALAAIRAAWGHAPRSAPPAPETPTPDEGLARATSETDLVTTQTSQAPVGLEVPAEVTFVPSDVEDVYELSASPALHDLEADLAAAAPPPASPSPLAALEGLRADRPAAEVQAPPARRKADKTRKRQDKARQTKARGKSGRPVQDEWGIFDPDQCGFSALVDKLDEVTEGGEARTTAERTTVRVISFS